MLVTPSMDMAVGRSVMGPSSTTSTPSRSSSRASQSKFRLAGAMRGGQGDWEDMEKGEMFGLGMGDIGGRGMETDESRTVRP